MSRFNYIEQPQFFRDLHDAVRKNSGATRLANSYINYGTGEISQTKPTTKSEV